jgi:hypothetical protein
MQVFVWVTFFFSDITSLILKGQAIEIYCAYNKLLMHTLLDKGLETEEGLFFTALSFKTNVFLIVLSSDTLSIDSR